MTRNEFFLNRHGKTRKARTGHRCHWCDAAIQPGSVYLDTNEWEDPERSRKTVKGCAACGAQEVTA